MKKILCIISMLVIAFLISCNASNASVTLYNVTFDPNNGEKSVVIEVEEGKLIEALDAPTKDSHEFLGWYKGDELFDFAYPIEENTYLIAKYEKIISYCNITFIVNENSFEETIEKGQLLNKPVDPNIDGFEFLGWFLADGTKYNFDTSVTTDLTLYARYDEVAPVDVYYTITFDNNDGSMPYSVLIKEGDTIESVEEPILDGHTFLGWKDSNDVLWPMSNLIYEDMNFVASWIKKEVYYTVRFENEDGSLITTKDVLADTLIIDSPSLFKEGYIFSGWLLNGCIWDLNINTVTTDITLTPYFEIDKTDWIYVHFLLDGDEVHLIHQPKGLVPLFELDEITGYDFLGWESDGQLWDFENDKALSDLCLTARMRRYYTITFDTNGGVELPSFKVYENEIFYLPTPTKDNHEFNYWSLDNVCFTDNLIYEDITLKAIWNEIHTITFVTDGDALEPISVVNGTLYSLTEVSLKKGYYFNGWLYDSNIIKEIYVYSDITLYAYYKEVDFDLSLLNEWEYYLYMDKVYATKYIGDSLEVIVPDVIDCLSSGVFNDCELKDQITSIKINNQNIDYDVATFNNLSCLSYFEFVGGNLVETSLAGCNSIQTIIAGNIVPVHKLFYSYAVLVPSTLTNIKLTNQNVLVNKHFEAALSLKKLIIENVNKLEYCYLTENNNIILDYLEVPFTGKTIDDENFNPIGASLIDKLVITKGESIYIWDNVNSFVLHDGVKKIYKIHAKVMNEIELPKSLTYIDEYAFYDWTNLKKVAIPDSITNIPQDLFLHNEFIEELTLPFVGTDYNSGVIKDILGDLYTAPLKKVTVTNQTFVPDNAYIHQSYLEEVIYNKKITSIGDYAFGYCWMLSSFYVPSDLNYLGEGAFYNCKSLTEFTIPTTITELKDYLLDGCVGITELVIPENITSIGSYSLASLSITYLHISNNVSYLGAGCLYGCNEMTLLYVPFIGSNIEDNENATLDYLGISNTDSKLKEIALRNTKHLSPAAFAEYELLEIVNILSVVDGLKEIPDCAFENSVSLKTVKLPDSVNYIGQAAFRGCSGLYSIQLSKDLTRIDKYAFSYCENLSTIEIYDKVTSVGSDAFVGTEIDYVYYFAETSNWMKIDFENEKGNPLHSLGVLTYHHQTALITPIISKDKLGSYALVGFDRQNIFYYGTEEEFTSLQIGEGNDIINSNIYFYSEEEPTVSDKYWHFVEGNYGEYLNAAVWKIE